jgi:hypothetical protein
MHVRLGGAAVHRMIVEAQGGFRVRGVRASLYGAPCRMIVEAQGGIWGAVVRAPVHGALCRMIVGAQGGFGAPSSGRHCMAPFVG